MATTQHVYEIFIRADRDTVWEALIDPEHTTSYFHGTRFESTFESGAPYRNLLPDGTVAVDGVVEAFEPPERLVLTWHVRYDELMEAEPPGRVEWVLTSANEKGDVTRVTLRHGDLASSPRTWEHVRLGWVEIIDGLKTLLETGTALPAVDTTAEPDTDVAGGWHRSQAIEANNSVWELLDGRDLDPRETDELLQRAYAAAYHWARAARREPANGARASWLLSRVHAVLGHAELARHHADRCFEATTAAGLTDFDLAYAHEARARALACAGQLDEAATERAVAQAVPIADDEDRAIVSADLAAAPWYGL